MYINTSKMDLHQIFLPARGNGRFERNTTPAAVKSRNCELRSRFGLVEAMASTKRTLHLGTSPLRDRVLSPASRAAPESRQNPQATLPSNGSLAEEGVLPDMATAQKKPSFSLAISLSTAKSTELAPAACQACLKRPKAAASSAYPPWPATNGFPDMLSWLLSESMRHGRPQSVLCSFPETRPWQSSRCILRHRATPSVPEAELLAYHKSLQTWACSPQIFGGKTA